WAPGGPAGPAGWDRRRVGARLRAALAGLHELQGLRATQQARVRGALAAHPPPGPKGVPTRGCTDLPCLLHPGFYELSDGGSCSLSTSCASVCSDRVSPSLSSLLPAAQPAKARPCVGDWRPRSADETSVPVWRPQATEDGSRPPGTAGGTGQPWGTFRPRPVSTGDLDRTLPADARLQKAGTDPRAPPLLCQGTDAPPHTQDPQYQRDLVSQGGREVYPYPSPLHAVALQSPLFALAPDSTRSDGPSPPRKPLQGPAGICSAQTGPVLEAGTARAYIDRLLRLRGCGTPTRGGVGEQGPPRREVSPSPREPGGQRTDSEGRLQKLVSGPGRAAGGGSPPQQGPTALVGTQHPSNLPEEGPGPSSRCVLGETTASPSPCSQARQPPSVVPPSQRVDKSHPLGSGPFPAREASLPRLNMGHPTAKAERTRRRPSDQALRSGKQVPSAAERHRGAHAAPWLPPEWDPTRRAQGAGGLGRPTLAREVPGRSCSESTLYPVPFLLPLVVAPGQGCGAAHALFPLGAAPLGGMARRRQRRWQSTVEISAGARPARCPEPSPGTPRPTARRAGGPRAQGRPSLARQDACTRSESDPSEPSTDCASPLHSTAAETSGEEASDHTANRFGDRESGGSDSEGGVRSRGRGRALDCGVAGRGQWAWLPAGPPAGSRPPLPPVPKLCRVKASRALKKKIRRFQPAALKVMTLV
uniref:Dishevelled binding antagonist of beta catenin 2 n=1 Tax=Propithecus coquereli TaxID=379532 RepID=A0A2K6FDX2_PROCO